MNITEIQSRLDAMAKAMGDKGLRMPEARIRIVSGCAPMVYLARASKGSNYSDLTHCPDGNKTLAAQLDDADAWIAALPDPETAGLRAYLGALSDAAEVHRQHALPDDLLVPVKAVIQTVSGNLLGKVSA